MNKKEQYRPIQKALLKWIEKHKTEEKDTPYLATGGKTYTLNELYKEIKDDTKIGRNVEQRLINLTIDLLFRGKEKLNT